MKTNKWVARVKGNDKDNWIRIGIIKANEGYEIIAENGDDVSTGIEATRDSAIEAIKLVWGNWNTFEWLDEKEIIRSAAAALGRKGGSVKSKAKSRASRENGKLGGRPRIIEDGWHTISGYDCCVEGGIVLRAVIGEGNSQTSGYPYRFDKKLGVWNKCTPKVATLKNGLAKGTYEIM